MSEKDMFLFVYPLSNALPGPVEENILHTLELRKDYIDELFKKYQEGFDW